MNRRKYITSILATTSVIGCIEGTPSTGQADQTVTPTLPKNIVASGPGEYPHEINLINERNESVEIGVKVKKYNTIFYQGNHTIDKQTSQTIAGFTEEELRPENQEFEIEARIPDVGTSKEDFRINSCHGSVRILIDDSLEGPIVGYGVC